MSQVDKKYTFHHIKTHSIAAGHFIHFSDAQWFVVALSQWVVRQCFRHLHPLVQYCALRLYSSQGKLFSFIIGRCCLQVGTIVF
jgi:EAL domain-containing protein (putative c-di-GMP-specific phosphodiesterase class I)